MKTNLNSRINTWVTIIFIGTSLITISCKNKVPNKNEVVIDNNNVKFINNPTDYDAQFLVTAAEMNLEEIMLGTLAQEKGTLTLVKDLGKTIKEDHQKKLNDLIELAKTKTVTIPAAATDKGNEDYKNLNKNSGKDFDKAYSNMMVVMHKNAINLFESASTDCADPHIKKWAMDVLSSLQLHLDQSLSCQKEAEKM
ncbi:MAG: DUF4142 domain-containing protein [Saprospiraceae bacterium]